MSAFAKLAKRLREEYGEPAVRRILSVLGDNVDEATIRRALKQQGYKPISSNPAADALRDATNRPAKKKKPAAQSGDLAVPRRTMTKTPDLRSMDTREAIKTARKQPHLIQDSSGQYVGAPRGVRTPEDIKAMRAKFDEDVAQSAEGADWYTRARAANEELAGPDPARQRLLAQEQALWSAQANPDTNLNFAVQAHNAYEMGVPLDKVRTRQQARTYREARDAGVDIPLGKKTRVYGQHLDPTVPHATTGTNDIWHARAFGYTNADGEQFSRALTDQEHRFLDYETMLAVDRANRKRLAGRSDWQAHEIQAAPWVAGKGRSLAQKIAGEGNEPTAEQLAEGMRRARMTYPDYLDKYTPNVTYELVPYSSSGHLEGIGAGPDAVRAEYSANPALSWGSNDGRDIIYDALGAYQRPTINATGVYTPPGGALETNPAFVARPLVGIAEGGVDPISRDMLDFAETLRGYLGAQGASAWHIGMGNVPSSQRGSVFAPADGPLPLDRLIELGKIGSKYGLPDFIDTGRGVTLTNFADGAPSGGVTDRNLQKGFADEIISVTGKMPIRVKVESSYLPILEKGNPDWGSDPLQGVPGSGWATDQLLALADKYPTAASKLDASGVIRSRALAGANVDEDYAARGFGATREDIQTARRIFAEKGFAGLREARRKGIALPGIAAFLSLYGLEDADDAAY
jgi:hypothetical protein